MGSKVERCRPTFDTTDNASEKALHHGTIERRRSPTTSGVVEIKSNRHESIEKSTSIE
ncbi:MAG: hypothetical protein JNK05_30655 [Myxococcales bacterium]|nr:hypothetical protein [Myxococcales bacterium]